MAKNKFKKGSKVLIIKYIPTSDPDPGEEEQYRAVIGKVGKIVEIMSKDAEPEVPIKVELDYLEGAKLHFRKEELVLYTKAAKILYGTKDV